MKPLLLVLAACLCTVYTASTTKDDKPSSEFESRRGDFLYTVALTMKEGNNLVKLCGGAELSRDWFITAAECFHNTPAKTMALTYGPQYDTNDYVTILSRMKNTQYVIHEQYNERTKANNIALVKCANCGRLGTDKIPKLPSSKNAQKSFSHEPAILTAVLNNDPSSVSNLLEENEMEESRHESRQKMCASVYNYGAYYQKTDILSPIWCKLSYLLSVGKEHMCASSTNGNLPKNAVGAPLVIEGESEGSLKLVGIATSISPWTSWIRLPMVFTRVAPYRDWIRNVTNIPV